MEIQNNWDSWRIDNYPLPPAPRSELLIVNQNLIWIQVSLLQNIPSLLSKILYCKIILFNSIVTLVLCRFYFLYHRTIRILSSVLLFLSRITSLLTDNHFHRNYEWNCFAFLMVCSAVFFQKIYYAWFGLLIISVSLCYIILLNLFFIFVCATFYLRL